MARMLWTYIPPNPDTHGSAVSWEELTPMVCVGFSVPTCGSTVFSILLTFLIICPKTVIER